ncbi:hypothetical protein [Alkalibacterium olivapovliticus]|uniref:YolD-like protein n=1 Tax=Alkalibacterium olivapovliticus TaxID=99907 RepID=A0A2T0WAX5_9LACT|nr:hypothetical protein [Alkalibacterium olivapovliticus]PRY83853.1 hypothetical protein CLV38_10234 [Alkalibacterium olivapovliticus]
MSKLAIETHHIFDVFKKGYGSLFSNLSKVQPQMPKNQLLLFLKQAVRKQQRIIVQVNPTAYSDQINEYRGTASFSPRSAQIILKTTNNHTTYLLNAKDIRHIRIVN